MADDNIVDPCKGKILYPTRELAEAHCRKLIASGRFSLNVYRHGDHFHIGNRKTSRKLIRHYEHIYGKQNKVNKRRWKKISKKRNGSA